MAKKTLKVSQLYVLQEELKELLSLELSFVLRYKFNDLQNKVTAKVAEVEKIKEELIKKYGEADAENPQQIRILPTVKDEEGNDINNPNFAEFVKEFTPILEETEEIESKEFKLEALAELKSEKPFQLIFEFVEE